MQRVNLGYLTRNKLEDLKQGKKMPNFLQINFDASLAIFQIV